MAHGFKSGGRTAGTPNRRTAEAAQVVERIEERLRAEGRLGPDETINPLERLALAMIDADASSAQRLAAAKELAKYLYPQRKAIDVGDTADQTPPMATRDAEALIEAAIERVERSSGEGVGQISRAAQ